MKSCPKGMILRKSYTRKIKRRNSAKTRKIRIASKCIRDLGKPGKGKKLIGPLKKGGLTKFGYSTKKTIKSRERALAKAVKHNDPLTIFRKLNAIYVLTKNTNKRVSRTMKRDRNWIKKKYMK